MEDRLALFDGGSTNSLFDEGTLEPGLGVGVGVPGLLLHREGGLGQEGLEPAGEVGANMIDLRRTKVQ